MNLSQQWPIQDSDFLVLEEFFKPITRALEGTWREGNPTSYQLYRVLRGVKIEMTVQADALEERSYLHLTVSMDGMGCYGYIAMMLLAIEVGYRLTQVAWISSYLAIFAGLIAFPSLYLLWNGFLSLCFRRELWRQFEAARAAITAALDTPGRTGGVVHGGICPPGTPRG